MTKIIERDEQLAKAVELTQEFMEFFAIEKDKVRGFPLDDSDVIIAGYPKSGTNWMQVVIGNLWDDWGLAPNRQVPALASRDQPEKNYYGFNAFLEARSPRLAKTHIAREDMPKRWPEHGKVVHITRNPKDVCVSYFHELKNVSRNNPDMTAVPGIYDETLEMSLHVRQFVSGAVPWGPYLENTIGWRNFDHPNLLKITYEEAKRDPRTTFEKIIAFIGRPVTQERLEKVLAETSFEAMRTSDVRFQINHPNLREDTDAPFMRKGSIGGWVDEMSAEDAKLIDKHIVEPLEKARINLTYS